MLVVILREGSCVAGGKLLVFFSAKNLRKCLLFYSGLHEKKEYRRLFNSYVANTVQFANRNSLGMAPPLACRALTVVKFPTKNGDDGLHQRVQFLNARLS